MAKRNGGIIGPSNVPNPFIAKGVWKLRDAFNYIKAGLWPPVLGYQVNNSLRFNSGSSDYLNRSQTTGNRQIYTFSFWIKKCDNSNNQKIFFATNGTNEGGVQWYDDSGTVSLNVYNYTGGWDWRLETTAKFRDPSAWYHIVAAIDTTQATDTNRVKIYVNGLQQTSFLTASYPSLNFNNYINFTGYTLYAGGRVSPAAFINGYLAEAYLIDGQQLTPSSFGQTDSATGIWTPKAYTGTYGTNGFYLKFANSAALGEDSSGNGNTFTANNLTSVDQSTDTPTNNFTTWNPLWFSGTTVPNTSFTEGNLTVQTTTTAGANSEIQGTMGVNKGKWYYEFKMTSTGTGPGLAVGFANNNYTDSLTYYSDNGKYYTESTSVTYGATWTTGDIIGVALDCDNNTMTFYKNGTSQGVITSVFSNLSTDFYLPIMWDGSGSLYANASVNFGSPPYAANSYSDANGFGNFSYAVPSGYYSLCTKNLAVYG